MLYRYKYFERERVNISKKGRHLIFIIDDDGLPRASLKLLVESAGHEGVTFKSAEEFLESGWNWKNHQVSCSLTSGCPGMSGFELQEYLNCVGNPDIPVIFITGHDRSGMEEKAMKLGAVAYLRKPFDDREFLNVIYCACKKKTYTYSVGEYD